ncbi:major facilitator superfamily permease [Apilactobacillus ozensis DSM 23829 = JCM 17196]|uniref:Major facilitator superfamily permease n=2 Tax=Apilactobacillus ozensis TaxID=866801 RepID=A0A0R2ALL8_9LACO|nr:MFS transporter [Apilactobacillus ozensis]KRM67583.1 major facilitator superfamily permease [Apilactobacillus ozensis DSM 23829 = JCM 17196]
MKHKQIMVILSVAIVSFLGTVDMSIVNTALPQISKDLNVPMNQAEWISSAYLILICMSLILFGKLGDQLSKSRIFQLGTLVFTISSLVCGLSTNLIVLLVARCLQGLGASMTMATNLGIITESVPFDKRGKALGINTTIGQLGYIAGPAVAGIILSFASWNWIFLFNVPIGIAAFIFGEFVYQKPNKAKPRAKLNLDYRGFITLAAAIGLFFVTIFIGQEIGFHNLGVISAFIITAILVIAFIRIELKVAEPILDLSLFKNPGFTISIIALMFMYIIIYFNNVLLPFYIQDSLKFSPANTGFIMSILPVVNVFTAYLGGVLCDKYGAVKMSFRASIIFVIAEVIFALVRPSWPLAILLFGFVIFSTANGLFQNNPMVMENARKDQQGVAGSVLALSRNIGFTVGLSLSTSLLYTGMSIKANRTITTYPFGHDDWFIFGMHFTYLIAAIIMLLVVVMLVWLMHHRKKIAK